MSVGLTSNFVRTLSMECWGQLDQKVETACRVGSNDLGGTGRRDPGAGASPLLSVLIIPLLPVSVWPTIKPVLTHA